MSEWLQIVTAAVVGGLVAGAYFTSLWWSVQRLPRSPRPLQVYFLGLSARLGLVLAVAWSILRLGSWPPVLGFLLGFALTRIFLVRRLAAATTRDPSPPGAV